MNYLAMVFFNLGFWPAFAADGPQNTGTLTLQWHDNKGLEGLLQIDRSVVTTNPSETGTAEWDRAQSLFRIQSSTQFCRVAHNGTVSNETVITFAMSVHCPSQPRRIQVSLANAALLPAGFSLGVIGASGHHSLTQEFPTATIILSRPLFYFEVGRKTFFSPDPLVSIGINRQAALWFGGFHRFPYATGWILLVAAIGLLPRTNRQKAWLGITSLVLCFLTSLIILSNQLTQTIHGLLYVSHVGFGVIASLFAIRFLPTMNWRGALSILLALIASIIYGLEQATSLWLLEKMPASELPLIVAGYYAGQWLMTAMIAAALFAIFWLTRRVTIPARFAATSAEFFRWTAGVGAAICIYLVVCLSLRVRF
jgi:hypothetical protein